MKKKAADLVAEAKSRVENLDPDAVENELHRSLQHVPHARALDDVRSNQPRVRGD